MRMMLLAIWGLSLLAVCTYGRSWADATGQSPAVPMAAQAWAILYSPGMPSHPTAQADGGWYFDFPSKPNSVHYVLTAVNIAASSYVQSNIRVITTQSPRFVYDLYGDNKCVYPAHARFLLQESGDDLSGTNGKQYFRWWSNSTAYQLAAGSMQLRASLTDLGQWTSVFGEKATASVAAAAGFRQALGNLANVGFSFGGGCFYGHGVRVSGGGAKFVVKNYILK